MTSLEVILTNILKFDNRYFCTYGRALSEDPQSTALVAVD